MKETVMSTGLTIGSLRAVHFDGAPAASPVESFGLMASERPLGEPLYLSVVEERTENAVVRRMHLDGKSIYFRITGPVLPEPLQLLDFAVVASIFTAMRLRRPLHVRGSVSRALLANLEEFQEAWATWLPAHYMPVRITADDEVDASPALGDNRGVFAFSGGIDGTFSLLRHLRRKAGRRTVEPVAAVLIHGFDLDLAETDALRIADESAAETLGDLGVPMAVVETNWKTDLCYNWRMEHAAGLAACMFQFNGVAGTAVIGGDEGYEKVNLPWGSNPVSNPLLSGGQMSFRTEGSSFPRSERLAFILQHTTRVPHLRVCWENARTGTNCGVCEKCIRTQLNFRAVGLEPQGFLRKAGLLRLAFVPTRSAEQNYEMNESQRAASRRGIWGAWRLAAYVGMGKNVLFTPLVIAKNKLKSRIRRNEKLYRRLKDLKNG